jgi:hypothetical protein
VEFSKSATRKFLTDKFCGKIIIIHSSYHFFILMEGSSRKIEECLEDKIIPYSNNVTNDIAEGSSCNAEYALNLKKLDKALRSVDVCESFRRTEKEDIEEGDDENTIILFAVESQVEKAVDMLDRIENHIVQHIQKTDTFLDEIHERLKKIEDNNRAIIAHIEKLLMVKTEKKSENDKKVSDEDDTTVHYSHNYTE